MMVIISSFAYYSPLC